MSDRALALADQFEQANTALIAALTTCDTAAWQAACPDTGWPVGVQADHIAAVEAFLTDRLGRIANGEAIDPLPLALIERENDRRAAQAANITPDQAIAQLREQGAAAIHLIRSLSLDQLARTGQIVAEQPTQSVEAWIIGLSIGEIERHGDSILQATTP
jgi:uncharacterized damage-inducible protein DinB